MTDGTGSTITGTPYEMKYIDDYGNVGKLLLFPCHINHYATIEIIVD